MEPVSSINKLNDDCLSQVFQFLPYTDRVRVERVCKRWHEVGLISWKQYGRSNPSLEIGTDTGTFPQKWERQNIQTLKQILRQRGSYLTKISFAESCRNGFRARLGMIKMVIEHCPRIREIHAENVWLWEEDLKAIAACRQIESLSFTFGFELNLLKHELKSVFKENKNLRHLTVSGMKSHIGQCLRYLEPDVLETLHIKSPNIELDLANMNNFGFLLRKLTEHYMERCSNYENLSYVCKLKNLRKLKVEGDAWDQSIIYDFQKIAQNCLKLEHVDLGKICLMVHDNVIGPFLALPELREFAIDKTNLTIEIFANKKLDKLESLTMTSCFLKRKDYQNLVKRLPKLKVLNICDCELRRESKWLRRVKAKGISVAIRFCENNELM